MEQREKPFGASRPLGTIGWSRGSFLRGYPVAIGVEGAQAAALPAGHAIGRAGDFVATLSKPVGVFEERTERVTRLSRNRSTRRAVWTSPPSSMR